MHQFSGSTQAALDYDSTIIGALEMSEKKWVLAVQLPGVCRHSRHVLGALRTWPLAARQKKPTRRHKRLLPVVPRPASWVSMTRAIFRPAAVRLPAQPHPREFDHRRPHPSVAIFSDPLFTFAAAAGKWRSANLRTS